MKHNIRIKHAHTTTIKLGKMLSAFLLFCVSLHSYAGWETVVSPVNKVATGWGENACIHINDNIVVLDLTSDKGRAEFSIALAAKVSGSEIEVLLETDGTLVGSCNAGDTHRKHAFITLR